MEVEEKERTGCPRKISWLSEFQWATMRASATAGPMSGRGSVPFLDLAAAFCYRDAIDEIS